MRRSGLSDELTRLLYLCMKTYFQDGVLAKVDGPAGDACVEARFHLEPVAGVWFLSDRLGQHPGEVMGPRATTSILLRATVEPLPKSASSIDTLSCPLVRRLAWST